MSHPAIAKYLGSYFRISGTYSYHEEDGSVSIDGDVYLSDQTLRKLPFPIRSVSGNFNCAHAGLTTLRNFPKVVHGNVKLSNMNFTRLDFTGLHIAGELQLSNLWKLSEIKCFPDCTRIDLENVDLTTLPELPLTLRSLTLQKTDILNLPDTVRPLDCLEVKQPLQSFGGVQPRCLKLKTDMDLSKVVLPRGIVELRCRHFADVSGANLASLLAARCTIAYLDLRQSRPGSLFNLVNNYAATGDLFEMLEHLPARYKQLKDWLAVPNTSAETIVEVPSL